MYATPYTELAALFAITSKFGGSYAMSLGYNKDTGKFIVVERIPNWISKINSKFSIYTLEGRDFDYFDKDNWGKFEVRADKPQKVINEKVFNSANDLIDSFVKLNKIEYYEYPKRPDVIPEDDTDLITIADNIMKMGNVNAFKNLLYYHPNLEDKVNKFLNQKHDVEN